LCIPEPIAIGSSVARSPWSRQERNSAILVMGLSSGKKSGTARPVYYERRKCACSRAAYLRPIERSSASCAGGRRRGRAAGGVATPMLEILVGVVVIVGVIVGAVAIGAVLLAGLNWERSRAGQRVMGTLRTVLFFIVLGFVAYFIGALVLR
jgi:hypothetical protein